MATSNTIALSCINGRAAWEMLARKTTIQSHISLHATTTVGRVGQSIHRYNCTTPGNLLPLILYDVSFMGEVDRKTIASNTGINTVVANSIFAAHRTSKDVSGAIA